MNQEEETLASLIFLHQKIKPDYGECLTGLLVNPKSNCVHFNLFEPLISNADFSV